VSRAERNVELVRRGLGAWGAGAFEESLATMHPDVEWHLFFQLPDLPARAVFHGRDQVRELWDRFAGAWEKIVIDVEEILHADEGRVVLRGRFRARGAESGVDVDQLVYYHFKIADGLLVYIRGFPDRESAWRDAGLDVG
jgi:ketosteroid isomerase-like protein